MNLEERRAWLETELGRKIPNFLWDELVKRRYAVAGEMNEEEEEVLVDQARFGLRMRRRDVPDHGLARVYDKPSWMDSNHDIRREVFAKCVAVMAENHPEVHTFRNEVLGGSFPLTYDQALRYVDEDGHVRKDAPHAQRLEAIIKILTKTFAWKAYDASWFVLCRYYTPRVETFGIETNFVHHEYGPEIGTITLTVEPWLPAENFVEMYKTAQRQMLSKKPHQASRKRLRLLQLVETMGEGLSWRERMNLWNEFHPEEEYNDRRNFRKAYIEARKLVLELGYTPARQDEKAAREDRRRIDRRRRIERRLRNAEREMRIIRKFERDLRIAREGADEVS